MKTKLLLIFFLNFIYAQLAYAEGFTVETKITMVAVNGANDTANPGTTCVTVSTPISSACTNGFIAIQNNNKQLVATALQAKATNSDVWLYYFNNETLTTPFHCPGLAFTPCSAISIGIR